MQATADSKTVKIKGASSPKTVLMIEILIKEFPRSVIRRCPAIRLAVSRTQSVIGRIRFLTISIKTINDIKAAGVPCGTKWDNMWLVFLNQPNKMIDIHVIKDKGSVIMRWEVAENNWGYKATKFNTKMEKKIVSTEISCPLFLFLKVKEISLCKTLMTFIFRVSKGETEVQLVEKMIVALMIKIIQALDKKEEAGSNTENKLFIIWYFCYFF